MSDKKAGVSGYYKYCGLDIPVRRYNTIVMGSGAAGFNAADSLYALGVRDVAIVTEGAGCGTSRNAGSDKQTYYKLTLGGNEPDSVGQMAETLYNGGCVDGDIALCEAGLSAECFFKLASLGVPFPMDRYGARTGYKTDHDPLRRATSAGPYTSRLMTEKLHESVVSKGIPIFDNLLAIKILTAGGGGNAGSGGYYGSGENFDNIIEEGGDSKIGDGCAESGNGGAFGGGVFGGTGGGADGNGGEITGVLCLDLAESQHGREAYAAFSCKNVILATGGPAGIYKDSAYPTGHHGANGLAFEAGAAGANLTEWQYGLASLNPRWNVSGTYMQALPRFISIDPGNGSEREFLIDYFDSGAELMTNIFLKGYQWPFDAQKVRGGSSLIDLCVFREIIEGRRVLLDYRDNFNHEKLDFNALSGEALSYLERAGACFGTPYERLCHMNMPAVEFYRSRGVDLSVEPLEIALCAQHNNGGIEVDMWWRTRVAGLFAAGESSATHGVRRPGGSALNAGQVGSLRAAQYIAARRQGEAPSAAAFIELAGEQIADTLALAGRMPDAGMAVSPPPLPVSSAIRSVSTAPLDAGSFAVVAPPFWDGGLNDLIENMRANMSNTAGAIRDIDGMRAALKYARETYDCLKCYMRTTNVVSSSEVARAAKAASSSDVAGAVDARDLPLLYSLRELCVSQIMYLSAFIDYYEKGGKSRGGAIYADKNGVAPHGKLPQKFAFSKDGGDYNDMIQETIYNGGENKCAFSWRKTRPIPIYDDFFENVWREFRTGAHIDE